MNTGHKVDRSDGDAVGDAPGRYPGGITVGGVGGRAALGEFRRTIPVLAMGGIPVHAHDHPFDPDQLLAELLERLLGPLIRCPLRCVALPEVDLIGGVVGEDLDDTHADDALELAGNLCHSFVGHGVFIEPCLNIVVDITESSP